MKKLEPVLIKMLHIQVVLLLLSGKDFFLFGNINYTREFDHLCASKCPFRKPFALIWKWRQTKYDVPDLGRGFI